MKGSIRFFAGFLVALGAVGTLEVNPGSSIVVQSAIALAGLAVMFSGAKALKNV